MLKTVYNQTPTNIKRIHALMISLQYFIKSYNNIYIIYTQLYFYHQLYNKSDTKSTSTFQITCHV